MILSVFAASFVGVLTPAPLVAPAGETITLHIEPMTCEMCVATVENTLKPMAGVRSVKVDLAAKLATVELADASAANVEAIIAALADHGKDASRVNADGSPLVPGAIVGKGYTLAWRDEFDGDKGAPPDSSRWSVYSKGPRRDAFNDGEQARLDGAGHLVLATVKVSELAEGWKGVKTPYRAPMISTSGRYEATYGYFEARVKFQTQPGHWSAFWLQSPTIGNPVGDVAKAGAEVDVIEYLATARYRDKALNTIHWDGYGEAHKSAHNEVAFPGLGEGWHVCAVLWTPEEYVFFVDGKETWRTKEGVSRRSHFLILSNEVGDWAGSIKDAKLPDAFTVDWVRVWQAPQGTTR